MPPPPSILGHPFRVLLYTCKALALGHLAVTYGYSGGYGWGPSMLPTFLTMDEWFVTSRACRRGRGIQVGDCIVYSIPVEPGEEGIKRVLGLPGDYVLLNSPGASSTSMIQVIYSTLRYPCMFRQQLRPNTLLTGP